MYIPNARRDEYHGLEANDDTLTYEEGMKAMNTEAHQAVFQEVNKVEEFDADEQPMEFLTRDSNIERLENASKVYLNKAMALLSMSDEEEHVDREIFLHVLTIQRARFYGCLSLPFSIFFFLMFALSSFMHEDIMNVFVVEAGLREVLGGGASDLHTLGDVWSWLYEDEGNSFLDQVFIQPEGAAGAGDKTMWNRVLSYNQLQGPVLIEQLRSETEMCSEGKGTSGDMVCYPMKTRSRERFGYNEEIAFELIQEPNIVDYADPVPVTRAERRAYYDQSFEPAGGGRRLREVRPFQIRWLPGGKSDNDAFQVFLFGNTPMTLLKEHLSYLKRRGWLDAATKQVTIKAFLLNAELGRPRLEQYKLIMKFSRGGGIFTRLTMEAIFLRMFAGASSMGCDFIVVCMLIFTTVVEIRLICVNKKAGNVKKHMKKFWSVLQWMIISAGWLTVLAYLAQSSSLGSVVTNFKTVVEAMDGDLPADRNQLGTDFSSAAQTLVDFNSWFRIWISLYHLLLMFRFFAAFHAQPRLGIVASTLEESLVDIIHFLVVLLPTFLAYAISGCFAFGRRMEEFSSLDGAIGICFKLLMEGEYDWPTLASQDYWTAALWTWSFLMLLVVLMLNMVLAIVLDVYTEIRQKCGNSETVITTIWHMVIHVLHRKQWVNSKQLREHVAGLPGNFTKDDLTKEFPGMCQEQLGMIMSACKYQSEVEGAMAMEMKGSMKMAMAAKLSIDNVREEVVCLTEAILKGQSGDSDPISDTKNWMSDIGRELSMQNHWMLAIQWQIQQLQWQWEAVECVHGTTAKFDQPLGGTRGEMPI